MKLDKILEATFSILSMIGSLMVANLCFTGWFVWIVSCFIAIVWGIRQKAWWFTGMQTFFLITNTIGVYNFFIK